ncbi:MAG: ribose-5-phosphate isomerase RpiA [Trueperaceae bacterium]|nr:ribose-5-phosphate isomerase RpiA [Trueperaceae bacterium]
MDEADRWKTAAARAALEHVRSGMLVGLGTGSTASHVVRDLGRRLAAGELRDVRGVATSVATERLAREAKIPLVELPASGVDLTIDGMDEVTPTLDAIKGLGGALTREKVVAASSARLVLIGDVRKRVPWLGETAPVPVEVLAFGWRRTVERLRELGAEPALRLRGGEPFVTDTGQWVVDCHVHPHFDAAAFAAAVDAVPGVIAHGLFLGMAERALLGGPDGIEELLRPPVIDGAPA